MLLTPWKDLPVKTSPPRHLTPAPPQGPLSQPCPTAGPPSEFRVVLKSRYCCALRGLPRADKLLTCETPHLRVRGLCQAPRRVVSHCGSRCPRHRNAHKTGASFGTVSVVSSKEKKKQAHPAGRSTGKKQLCVGESACGPRKVMPSGFSTGFYEEHVMRNPPLFGPRLSVHKDKRMEGVGIALCKWIDLLKPVRRYARTSSPLAPSRWQVAGHRRPSGKR